MKSRQSRQRGRSMRSAVLRRGAIHPVGLVMSVMVMMLSVSLSGCAREERMVNYKPFFTGLSGAQLNTPATGDSTPKSSGAIAREEDLFQPVLEHPDGRRTLQSKTGMQLMYHIQWTLQGDERELFVEQVLSEITRREYTDRNVDINEAFDRLKKRERDIAMLFSRMPMGENSPNVLMRPMGANMFRLQLSGAAARDMHFRGFDMVLESGNWRLRWFF